MNITTCRKLALITLLAFGCNGATHSENAEQSGGTGGVEVAVGSGAGGAMSMQAGSGGLGSGGAPGSGGALGSGGSAASGTGGASGLGPKGSGGAAAGDDHGASGGAGGPTGSGGTGDSGTGGSSGADGGVGKSSGCGASSWPTSKSDYTIMVSNSSRSYILRIPDDYDSTHPYRLILAYHWLNGTASDVANGNNWATGKPYYGLWDMAGGSTIFVAPQGIGNAWRNTDGEDVAFTRALLEQLESQLCIDTSRIFAEGFSMGGSMSYAIACAMGDVVRAVAVHSGGPMSGCDQSSRMPVPYFMTHGINDSVCTYPEYGVPQLDDFAMRNGCTAQSLPAPSGNAPSCVDFADCMSDDPVRACVFVGDHTPSPPSTSNTWVPQETWKFLTQF